MAVLVVRQTVPVLVVEAAADAQGLLGLVAMVVVLSLATIAAVEAAQATLVVMVRQCLEAPVVVLVVALVVAFRALLVDLGEMPRVDLLAVVEVEALLLAPVQAQAPLVTVGLVLLMEACRPVMV
jgi:hypothetical protein